MNANLQADEVHGVVNVVGWEDREDGPEATQRRQGNLRWFLVLYPVDESSNYILVNQYVSSIDKLVNLATLKMTRDISS